MSANPAYNAIKFESQVLDEGRLELHVPFPPGSRVVGDDDDSFSDLVDAAQTSADFWDNPEDDEDWNA